MNTQQQIPGSYIIKKSDSGNQNNTPTPIENHNSKVFVDGANDQFIEGNNYPIEIQQIQSELLATFEVIYDKDFAAKLLLAFDKVITKEVFDELELIADDLEDAATSAILDSIWNDVEEYLQDIINDKKTITKGLQDIINSKYKSFNIKDFTFTVHQHDVNQATKLAEAVAGNIYGNSATQNGKKQMNINAAENKSLCISKAVDIKNGFPISKWLLDSFSRDRVINHKLLYEKFDSTNINEYPFHLDKYCTGYNATTWWLRDSTFCKYIQYKNAKMALPLMTAIQALSKRALPQLNFNSQLSPVIHDNLNDFVKYTLAFWSVAHESITNKQYFTETKTDETINNEIQIDCWIIPQLVKPPLLGSLFNHNELFNTNDDDDSDTEARNELLSSLNLNFMIGNHSQNKCNKFGKSSSMNKVKYPLWNLEDILRKAGYVQGQNYWISYAELNLDEITDQLNKMLQHANNNTFVGGRYIFIIDRRHHENVTQKNMGLKPPNYFKDKTQDIADKIYLIATEQTIQKTNCDKTTSDVDGSPTELNDENKLNNKELSNLTLIPEIYWSRSKQFLLPTAEEKGKPIGITDTLNGYKFVFSFHLKKFNSCSVYWYSDSGAIKFELQDMKWLFTRYFCKINDKQQKLNDENLLILEKWMKEKELNDAEFDNFRRQARAMMLIYDK